MIQMYELCCLVIRRISKVCVIIIKSCVTALIANKMQYAPVQRFRLCVEDLFSNNFYIILILLLCV